MLAAVAATVLLALALVAFLFWSKGPSTSCIVVGTLRGGVSSIDIVERLGLGEKYGVHVKVVRFQSTLDLANAFSRGDVDVAIIPAEFVARLRERGVDAVIAAVDFYQNQAIVARKELSSAGLESLFGKRLGVFKPTGTYAMFRAYIKLLYGADVEKTFTIVNLPPMQLVEAFSRGDVDAVVVWEPLVSLLVAEHGGHIVTSFQDLWSKAMGSGSPVMVVYAVRKEWAEANSKLLEALLRARSEAAHLWNTNLSLAKQILADLYGVAGRAAELCWKRLRMVETVWVTRDQAESVIGVWKLAKLGGYISTDPEELARGAFLSAGS